MKGEWVTVERVTYIGSNFEISIGETAQIISEAIGCDSEIVTDEQRIRPKDSEVERLWADNTKAKKLLNWLPTYGGREGFRRGIERTVAWFSEDSNLNKYKPDTYNI